MLEVNVNTVIQYTLMHIGYSQRQMAASRRKPLSGGKQVGNKGCRT